MSSVARRVTHYFPAYVPYRIDVFRGDSWQWLVRPAGKALKLAILLRALLRQAYPEAQLDTRIAIGIGEIQAIPEGDLGRGDGEAFRLSGELLEQFGRGNRLRVAFPAKWPPIMGEALDQLLQLIDLQVRQWTTKQAHAVAGAIIGYTQQEAAQHWFKPAISQQAVGQHLERAGWNTIEDSTRFFERTVRLGGKSAPDALGDS
jgi:hypothetical protein